MSDYSFLNISSISICDLACSIDSINIGSDVDIKTKNTYEYNLESFNVRYESS